MYYCSMSELPILSIALTVTRTKNWSFGISSRLVQHDGPQFYTLLAVGGENERPLRLTDIAVLSPAASLAAKALPFDPSWRTGAAADGD